MDMSIYEEHKEVIIIVVGLLVNIDKRIIIPYLPQ